MARPRIGVTVSRRSGWRIFPLIWFNVRLAGGTAVRWQAGRDIDMDAVDGVIIGGGDDIAPTLYGGEVKIGVRLDPDRDALEADVIRQAFQRDIPILGICRGSQMINVVSGGTLHQDAYGVYTSKKYRTILPKKRVTLEKGSLVAETTQVECVDVNALHTQAVDKLGDCLKVVGRDEGGMVQAIERDCDPFALGVQWHPEHLFYRKAQRRIFGALVAAARARQQERDQISYTHGQAVSDSL